MSTRANTNRRKVQACSRFEGSIWRPLVCRRCFANKSEHDAPGAQSGSQSSPGNDLTPSARKKASLTATRSVGLTSQEGHGNSHSASEAEPGKWRRSGSVIMTSGTRHVVRAEKKSSPGSGSRFARAEVVVVGSNGTNGAQAPSSNPVAIVTSAVQFVAKPSSAEQGEAAPSVAAKSPPQSPLDSPCSPLDPRPVSSTALSDSSGQDGGISSLSSDSNQSTLVKGSDEHKRFQECNGEETSPESGLRLEQAEQPVERQHSTDQEDVSHPARRSSIVSHSRMASEEMEGGGAARSRRNSACNGVPVTPSNAFSRQNSVASMSTEALDQTREPPRRPSSQESAGSQESDTAASMSALGTSIDNLLAQLQNPKSSSTPTPAATAGVAAARPGQRFGNNHRYSPHHQYRLPRDNRRQGFNKTTSAGELTNGSSRSSRKDHQFRRSMTDGPSNLLKPKKDLSMSDANMSSPQSLPAASLTSSECNGSDSCTSPTLPDAQSLQPSTDESTTPVKTHDASVMKFIVSQLEHISASWKESDRHVDDLRAMSLADYRLVEDMAADWCDGTAATPLWQVNDPATTGAATAGSGGDDSTGEATLPVVCIRPGLKQPGRIYGMRVRAARTGRDADVSRDARFKTNYRVLERIRPHANVLRVLAHFRDSVPAPSGSSSASSSPQAIFVVNNHLPLLNCRQYIPKCKEMLSKEGYERCVALLLYQLFDGLHHLHREGAIHCNLTLDNLLVVPTSHPGGGDRLVISAFGDSIYYSTPPEQFTVLTEQAAGMLDNGRGWKTRCQPPELLMAQREVKEGRKEQLIDLRHCDVYRSGQILYQMLGLESDINDYVKRFSKKVQEVGLKAGLEDTNIQPPSIPIISCFSEPLANLAGQMINKDPAKRLEPKAVLDAVGCILWGPTTSRGSLGLDQRSSASGWLRKRQLEVLGGFAGAYASPTAGQQQQPTTGGFALADELQCGYLVKATAGSIQRSLKCLQQEVE